MGIALSQIKHVKLPVADLRRSASWYGRCLISNSSRSTSSRARCAGVSLLDRDGGFEISLRQREYCAGQPRLAGFDVFALRSPTKELLATIAERCDRFGIQRTQEWDFPGYAAGFDIPDPDGTLVRIVWHDPQGPSGFLGMAVDADGQPQQYSQPRLDLGGQPG